MQSGPPNVVGQMGLKPGRWHTVIRITAATALPASGKVVPENIQTELRKKVGSSFETEDCIGSNQIPHSDLVLPGIKIASECTLGEVEADRRHLKLRASCGSLSDGFRADVDVEATHTDVAMTANAETSAFSKAAGFGTKINVTTSSTYAGECRSR